MKNTLFTLIIMLMCSNGLVLSQGQLTTPSINLTERTIIRDTLGKVLKLAECSEYLNAEGWIFQPEKNEGGKVLYYLLRKTTKAENELISNKGVTTIANRDINSVKKGRYIIQSNGLGEIDVVRRRRKQIERSVNAEGEKIVTKYRIVWSDDMSYTLTSKGRGVSRKSGIRYKVAEIAEDFFSVRAIGEKFLGDTVKFYF